MNNRRWYDKDPALANIVEQLRQLPPEILDILAQGVVEYTRRDTLMRRYLENGLKQLGVYKITGIYKSKQAMRWYDQQSNTKQFFHNLYVLEPEQRAFVMEKVKDLFTMVTLYVDQCDKHTAGHDHADVSWMAKKYLDEGNPQEVKQFLGAVLESFRLGLGLDYARKKMGIAPLPTVEAESITHAASSPIADPPAAEGEVIEKKTIEGSDRGMRIRGDHERKS